MGGTAQNNPQQTFNPYGENQRPGLLLMNGVVYAAFAGNCDKPPYQGWVLGVSTEGHMTSQWVAVSGTKNGAGIWQSAAGLASDRQGDVLFVTGNGGAPNPAPGFPPPSDLGESVVRLRVQPDSSLKAVDFFAPYDAPTLDSTDSDFGSGGPLVLPNSPFGATRNQQLMLAIGKQGYLYVLDRNQLGGMGQGPSGSDAAVARLGPFGGVWSKPSAWPGDGGWVYLVTTNGSTGPALNFLKYGEAADGKPSFSLAASASGYPYGSSPPVISSDGTKSGSATVWVDKAASNSSGELRAYRPDPSDGTPRLLFSAALGPMTRWVPPGIGDNRVIVPSSNGSLVSFGSPVDPPLRADDTAFGTIGTGESKTLTTTLTATRPLVVNGVSTSTPEFTAGTPSRSLPATLAAGDTISVPVTFQTTHAGTFSDALSVTTSSGSVATTLRGDAQEPQGRLQASAPKISFGGTRVGGDLSETVTFKNVGATPVTISSTDLPGAPFSIGDAPADGTSVAPGATLTVSARFQPTAVGAFEDAFVLHTDGAEPPPPQPPPEGDPDPPGEVTLALGGTASPPPVMSITPMSIDFGDVPVGRSVVQDFTITNTGGSPLTITRAKVPSQGEFSAIDIDEGTVLQAGASITRRVTFTPTSTGTHSDEWSLNGDDDQGIRAVSFTGRGVGPAASAWVYNGILHVDGRPDSSDPLTISRAGGRYTVKDAGLATAPGPRCRRVADDQVSCEDAPSAIVDGGAQDDSITLNGSIGGTVTAGPGDDYVAGGSGNDLLYGDDGDDKLYGRGGNDDLRGGSGDDRLGGQEGNDLLHGGPGTDTVTWSDRTAPLKLTIGGKSGEDGEKDTIYSDNEIVWGGAGNDTITGNVKGETLFGRGGNDRLVGLGGNDTLVGGPGNDTLVGGDGNDRMLTDTGADDFQGGNDFDTVDYGDRTRALSLSRDGIRNDGEAGENDFIRSDVEDLRGGLGNDLLIGSATADDVLEGWGGKDELRGNGGNDTLDGGTSDDKLLGGTGNDALRGASGNDSLSGEDGDDSLDGGTGDDALDGGIGTDAMTGGSGIDKVTYAGRTAKVVLDARGGAVSGEAGENDSIADDIETLVGGDGDDDITGNDSANVIVAGPGKDNVSALGGADRMLLDDGALDVADGGEGDDYARIDIGDVATNTETLDPGVALRSSVKRWFAGY
jgi:iron transport multicopper oxidase